MSSRPAADFVLVGASEVVTCAGPWPARGRDQSRVAPIEEGAVAALNGVITWVGPGWCLDREVDVRPGATRIDVRDRAVLPGLVDAHTHLVWAGDRAGEFEQRLAGATYSEIAARGGGILSTVAATREASEDELADLASVRIARMLRRGTTAVEIKSGYGLSLESELKILRAARRAARAQPVAMAATFLGAHTLPAEARGGAAQRERYVDQVCAEMIPRVAEEDLAVFADVFVDQHAFSLDEARRVLRAAKDAGLGVKVHADQLADDGAAKLAAEMGATSADHLEYTSEEGLRALGAAGTVAVLLPGASLFLGLKRAAAGRRMVDLGVPVALATDLNPGTCPCESLALMMQLGCLVCGLSVDEAIVAATLNAAAASGLASQAGSIEVGKRCDLVVLDAADRRQAVYQLGGPALHLVIAKARIVM
ncbi:MAG: imidazolonepropionase [Acidobacteria bacterium]|nr:imidazolonepropionase [Acidobacteriota bacterium]